MLEKIIGKPFLVSMHYAFQTKEKLYIVLDFVQGGELFTHLYKHEHFEEPKVRIYIAEIILALEQLHTVSTLVILIVNHCLFNVLLLCFSSILHIAT